MFHERCYFLIFLKSLYTQLREPVLDLAEFRMITNLYIFSVFQFTLDYDK